jgi:hypothetical protein
MRKMICLVTKKYSNRKGKSLVLTSRKWRLKREYRVGEAVCRLSVHPGGRRLLVHAVSPMGPLLMLDLRSGAVMLKYSDIQVGEMILQSHGTAADAGPPLRGCHDQVFRHTGKRMILLLLAFSPMGPNNNHNHLADIPCSGG